MRMRAHMDKDGKLNWGMIEMVVLVFTIAAFLYSGFGNYAVMANDVEQNTVDIKTNTMKVEIVDDEVEKLKLKIAGMEPVLQDVKTAVDDFDDKMDAIIIGLSSQKP